MKYDAHHITFKISLSDFIYQNVFIKIFIMATAKKTNS